MVYCILYIVYCELYIVYCILYILYRFEKAPFKKRSQTPAVIYILYLFNNYLAESKFY